MSIELAGRVFHFGYRPSPPGKLGLGAAEHLDTGPVPVSGEVLLPPAVDQGRTNSCTGNSSAVAICAKMGAAVAIATGTLHLEGTPWPELPSRLFLYYLARAQLGEVDRDEGAYVHSIFEQAAKVGFPRESDWPFYEELARVTAAPDWHAYQCAADQRIKVRGAWRIVESGYRRVDALKRAIAAGDPVVWGTQLDNAFLGLEPGKVWPGVRGAKVGGHAMVLHRFDGDTFWTRSSWGDEWCEEGSARISAEALASPEAHDFNVVDLIDGYSEAA